MIGKVSDGSDAMADFLNDMKDRYGCDDVTTPGKTFIDSKLSVTLYWFLSTFVI